jgi:hypothetical protein
MNKKTIGIALALFALIAIGVVFAQVCYFSDGVSVRWDSTTVYWSNNSGERRNAFHKITFWDGTTMGPRNISVPAGGTSEKFSKVVTNVEQCY